MIFFNKKTKKDELKKRVLQNPRILEINLVKDEIQIDFNWSRNFSLLMVVLFITGFLVAEIYFGLDWWEQQEVASSQTLSQDISKIKAEVNKINAKTKEALVYKEKSLEVTQLLNNHIYWSNFLNWLEKNTLSTVRYSGLDGDLSGEYNFTATAKTYADASWQAKAFLNDPMTKEVSIKTVNSSATKDAPGKSSVNFNIELTVKPEIFKK